MNQRQVRTVNIAKEGVLFYVVVWGERVSKSRVFRTLVAAQNHAKRLLLKKGTILSEKSLPIVNIEEVVDND